jgi:CRP-like cAMP-binding protein
LYDVGASVDSVFFPESGAISLLVDLSTGEAIESALIGFDGAIGAGPAIYGIPALNRAVVQISGSAQVISAQQLRVLCDKHNDLATALGRHHHFIYAQAQQSAACNALRTVEGRLSRWLLRIHDLCGLSFTVTQEALAAFMGVRRTSVSITAHAFQNAGMIRYRRGRIEILDLERLRKSACECHAALNMQLHRLHPVDPSAKVYSAPAS